MNEIDKRLLSKEIALINRAEPFVKLLKTGLSIEQAAAKMKVKPSTIESLVSRFDQVMSFHRVTEQDLVVSRGSYKEALKRKREEGVSFGSYMAALNLSRNELRVKVAPNPRARTPMYTRRPEVIEHLKIHFDRGLSVNDAAKAVGLSHATVYRWLQTNEELKTAHHRAVVNSFSTQTKSSK